MARFTTTADRAGPVSAVALPLDPGDARHHLERFLAADGWAGDREAVVLATHEALANAHRHGGGPRSADVWREGTAVVVEVVDAGPGFDPRPYVRGFPPLLAERGRGLWLIDRMASRWDVRREGGAVRLRLRFDGR